MSLHAAVQAQGEAKREAVTPVITPARSLRLHKRCACGGGSSAQSGECETCASQNSLSLQRRSDGTSISQGIPTSVNRALSQPGRPLEATSRSFMESRFGQDFSAVRVHDESTAAQSASDVQALAYTVGQDIVFAPGQYQPHSESGRHLLAHELAHTVQQKGLQRSGTASLADQGPEYRSLEAEADVAADFVTRGAQPSVLHSASRPTLSRTPAVGNPVGSSGTVSKTTGVTLVIDGLEYRVFQAEGFRRGGKTTQAFDVDPFYLPSTKGPRARAMYKSVAEAGALQATIKMNGKRAASTAQKQQRDGDSVLRTSWLREVGWPGGQKADENWQAVSGTNETFPRVNRVSCEVDHIVELQLGGSNVSENLQMEDGDVNGANGRAIWNRLKKLAEAIQDASLLTDGQAVDLQLNFMSVDGGSAPQPQCQPTQPTSCSAIDFCARKRDAPISHKGRRDSPDQLELDRDAYEVSASGLGAMFQVPRGFASPRNSGRVTLFDEPLNRASAQLISGLLMKELVHPQQGKDSINAEIDTRGETNVPIALEKDTRPVTLTVEKADSAGVHPLKFHDAQPNVRFNYKWMSPGTITQIDITPEGKLNWKGEIRSNVPFVPKRLPVVYANGLLSISGKLDREKLQHLSPIPGFRVTEANLDLALAPELSGTGNLSFAIGPSKNPIMTGSVSVKASTAGFTADGDLEAHIPGVDKASGEIHYRNGAWAGQVKVVSSQLPNVKKVGLQIDLDEKGVHPSGGIELDLPGKRGNLTFALSRADERVVYTGSGTLNVPGLRDDVKIFAVYDGESLSAEAKNVGFKWHGFDGHLDVRYVSVRNQPGRISGKGQVNLARGDVAGSLEVELNDNGKFSGAGHVIYPLTIRGKRIDAAARVAIDEKQQVHVEGALRLAEPIHLFDRFGDEKTLFKFPRVSIPIPGLRIGPVGVDVVIFANISARYGFGPGELRNVVLTAAFNPLAEKIDPAVSFHGELHIPAAASIAGTLGGGIAIDATIARVEGTISVTADLGLAGEVNGPLDLRYEDRKFAFEARPGIDAELGLGLSLDAHARAEAGFGPFSVSVEKSWNLGRRKVVVGQFSMHAPIGWSSDGGFKAPTIDQIQWGPAPEIHPGDLLSQLFSSSSAKERET